MARRPNDLPTVELRIATNGKVVEMLRKLVAQGLFGKNPSEAAERLVTEKLRELKKTGDIRK